MAPKRSAKVLSNAPKRKRAVMCLTEKIRVLDKLRSGLSYSAVGREFNVNESTIQYIQKKRTFADLYVRPLQKGLKSHRLCVMQLWKRWKSG